MSDPNSKHAHHRARVAAADPDRPYCDCGHHLVVIKHTLCLPCLIDYDPVHFADTRGNSSCLACQTMPPSTFSDVRARVLSYASTGVWSSAREAQRLLREARRQEKPSPRPPTPPRFNNPPRQSRPSVDSSFLQFSREMQAVQESTKVMDSWVRPGQRQACSGEGGADFRALQLRVLARVEGDLVPTVKALPFSELKQLASNMGISLQDFQEKKSSRQKKELPMAAVSLGASPLVHGGGRHFGVRSSPPFGKFCRFGTVRQGNERGGETRRRGARPPSGGPCRTAPRIDCRISCRFGTVQQGDERGEGIRRRGARSP